MKEQIEQLIALYQAELAKAITTTNQLQGAIAALKHTLTLMNQPAPMEQPPESTIEE